MELKMREELKNLPDLKLFLGFPEKFSSISNVASALQSFETAIYCIALGRWPATVGLVWQANELLLQHLYKGSLDENSTMAAMKKHLDEKKVSNDLNNAAHKLRKTRNDFMHNGFSPKDDLLSIRMYFEAGVPYFDNLLKTAFECNVYDFCGTGNTRKWFWDIYRNTRKLTLNRIKKDDKYALNATNLFVRACHKIVSTGGRFEDFVFSYNPYEYFLINHQYDFTYEIEKMIIEEFISDNFSEDKYGLVWLNINCDICSTELMGICEWDENDKFVKHTAFGCAKCGYSEKAQDAVNCFLSDPINKNSNIERTFDNLTLVTDRESF